MWNLVKIAQAVSEKKTFKNYTFLYMYITQGQGQVTSRGQNLIIAKMFTTLFTHWNFHTLVCNTVWENDFSTISPYKCIGMQIWPCQNRSKVNLRSSLNKLGRPWVLDAICHDSAPKLSWFWRRRFLNVFTIYGHGGHLVQWPWTIWINWQYPFDTWPHVKSGENCSSVFREEDI